MSIDNRSRLVVYRTVAMCCVLGLVVTVGLWWALSGSPGPRFTAFFDRTVGLYEGSDVRVLGVEVGKIDEVHPVGKRVRVGLSLNKGVRVPAEAKAVLVAPSLVSDRYVQLTPAYGGGNTMDDGTVIPQERTATPVELDQLAKSANKLTTTLGPNGANSDGALSKLLDTGAANLDGNGKRFGKTLNRLGEASRTLANSQGDMFGTVDNLNTFTKTLAESDSQVRRFTTQLADVSEFLAGERQNLGAAVNELAGALDQVNTFVDGNREKLKSNVDKLSSVSKVLVDQRAALAEILDVAPTAISNLTNTYNAASRSIDVRPQINELEYPPALMVCKLIEQSQPRQVPKTLTDVCEQLAPLLDGTSKMPKPSEIVSDVQRGEVPDLPLPLVKSLFAGQQGGGS